MIRPLAPGKVYWGNNHQNSSGHSWDRDETRGVVQLTINTVAGCPHFPCLPLLPLPTKLFFSFTTDRYYSSFTNSYQRWPGAGVCHLTCLLSSSPLLSSRLFMLDADNYPDESENAHRQVYGGEQPHHESHFSHELAGGAASFGAMKLFEDHQRKQGMWKSPSSPESIR